MSTVFEEAWGGRYEGSALRHQSVAERVEVIHEIDERPWMKDQIDAMERRAEARRYVLPSFRTTIDQDADLARAQRCTQCGEFVGYRMSHESKRCRACDALDVRSCSVCRERHGQDVVHSAE